MVKDLPEAAEAEAEVVETEAEARGVELRTTAAVRVVLLPGEAE